MKKIMFLLLTIFSLSAGAQKTDTLQTPDITKKLLLAEAACGQCQLGLPGEDCDLAVRIDGKAFYVDGTHIDDHGDAHAKDGFCNSIRKAKVQGSIVDGRFKATYFQLQPKETKKKK